MHHMPPAPRAQERRPEGGGAGPEISAGIRRHRLSAGFGVVLSITTSDRATLHMVPRSICTRSRWLDHAFAVHPPAFAGSLSGQGGVRQGCGLIPARSSDLAFSRSSPHRTSGRRTPTVNNRFAFLFTDGFPGIWPIWSICRAGSVSLPRLKPHSRQNKGAATAQGNKSPCTSRHPRHLPDSLAGRVGRSARLRSRCS